MKSGKIHWRIEMLSFAEVRKVVQKRYNLSAATANETTKIVIDDAKAQDKCFHKLEDLISWLEYLESLGN